MHERFLARSKRSFFLNRAPDTPSVAAPASARPAVVAAAPAQARFGHDFRRLAITAEQAVQRQAEQAQKAEEQLQEGRDGREEGREKTEEERENPKPKIQNPNPWLAGRFAPVIQGKFGYEFQSRNSFVHHNPASSAEKSIPIVKEKEIAFQNPAKKFKVEGDEGKDAEHFDVEFITEALNSLEEARIAMEGASALAANLGQSGVVKRDKDTGFDGGKWLRDVAIDVGDVAFYAKPQASIGVSLADIPELMQRNLPAEEMQQIQWSTRDLKRAMVFDARPALEGLLSLIAYYIKEADTPNPRDDRSGDNPEAFPDLGYQILVTDGPKAKFAIMARTDFFSMFQSLPEEDKRAFEDALKYNQDMIVRAIGRSLDDPLFSDPYRADKIDPKDREKFDIREMKDRNGVEHEIVWGGPSILDWLLSIPTGISHAGGNAYAHKGRDMLSAPVGWGSRKPNTVDTFPTNQEIVEESIYGMGAYPMDKAGPMPLAIFELRNFSGNFQNQDVPAAQWWQAAQFAIMQKFPGSKK